MRPVSAYACLAMAAAHAAMPARADPGGEKANNWADLRAALAKCWTVPGEADGSLIAYRFGLDKNGAVRGKPRIIARQFKGNDDAKQRYQEGTDAVLARCLPIPVTPAFGAILGESPIYLRFVNTPPTGTYQLNSNITLFRPN